MWVVYLFIPISVYTCVCMNLCVCLSMHLWCEQVCLFCVSVSTSILEDDCVSESISGAVCVCLYACLCVYVSDVCVCVSETVFEPYDVPEFTSNKGRTEKLLLGPAKLPNYSVLLSNRLLRNHIVQDLAQDLAVKQNHLDAFKTLLKIRPYSYQFLIGRNLFWDEVQASQIL